MRESYIHIYIHVYIHIHIYIYTCIYTYIYIYTYISTHTHIYIYIYTYICIQAKHSFCKLLTSLAGTPPPTESESKAGGRFVVYTINNQALTTDKKKKPTRTTHTHTHYYTHDYMMCQQLPT
eukprot:GHVQ01029412.1.p1 GENE.GHVQ01029412.1~~GHVQ01029412.1.p1  ORF type:complete len:122 (-),score=9.63 GHVQ01029412.1:447-812(-)